MNIIRLILGVLAAMLVLTVIVEGVEFLIVKMDSGQSMEYLSSNQPAYFKIRNQNWILILKVVYTFLSALFAGWLGSKITKQLRSQFLMTMLTIQVLAFIYAMFFSEFKDTLPFYYWILLLISVLGGLYLGHRTSKRSNSTFPKAN